PTLAVAKPTPQSIEKVAARWKAYFPNVDGSLEEHLNLGEAKLALDTTTGYEVAQREFQKALLLDVRSARAVGGYVQALALSKGASLDQGEFDEALGLLSGAEQ